MVYHQLKKTQQTLQVSITPLKTNTFPIPTNDNTDNPKTIGINRQLESNETTSKYSKYLRLLSIKDINQASTSMIIINKNNLIKK